MEDNERIAKTLEVGPLRRLEVLSRWMVAMDVDTALCRLLEESLEDLRDVLLHLKASPPGDTPVTEHRVAGWQEVPDPSPFSLPATTAPSRTTSLTTMETGAGTVDGAHAQGTEGLTPATKDMPSGEAMPPRLADDLADISLPRLGRAPLNGSSRRAPALRKPAGEHREHEVPCDPRAEALRAALQEAKADHARARARSIDAQSRSRLLDAELDFLIEHTLSRLLAS